MVRSSLLSTPIGIGLHASMFGDQIQINDMMQNFNMNTFKDIYHQVL